MQRRALISLAALAALGVAGCATSVADPQAVLRQADAAMGAGQLKTLRFAANGSGGTFGQAFVPGQAWPRINIPSFARWIDYDNAAMREDSVRTRAEPTGGGALPLMGTGEQRVSAWVRGNQAWNMAGTNPQPAPVALDARIHDLWTTPHGVVKAAMRNNATVRAEGGLNVVSFNEPGRYRATAYIGADGLVQRVDSVMPNPVTGDTQVSTVYSGWRDWGGVKFPSRIQQTQGGHPVYDLTVTEVQANPALDMPVPAPVAGFSEKVDAQQVVPGVWFLAGGSHNSVLVEFSDHLMLIESPLYDGRAQAVLAEARRLVPNKPVRYVVNSHHHFDHAGGLRTAASSGATLVVSEQARPWYERVFATPNAIRPDLLQQSGRRATLTGVNGSRTFGDATRTVEVHFIDGSVHAQGFMMAWLPRERLLVEADAYTPAPPNAPPPNPVNANNVNLFENVQRLGWNPDRILPLHGRVVPFSELRTAIGRN
ncbi:MBL fold metallo-hydrolase [Ramlibacter alkalitolerans]|uniref:MBL fold metallo-hydrolase n=1 Tax=Ramlibacter alkalitolerans TaxID=2039631 RepID=A0ABS1JIP3_9BURK|nr:MBL fold metallo-hydrolase [Ramlibacter alkalitolerans]MBL0423690.1 MBL fold metallo-hydrolase [Ramlibacter alkalitolerans]